MECAVFKKNKPQTKHKKPQAFHTVIVLDILYFSLLCLLHLSYVYSIVIIRDLVDEAAK